MQHVIAFDRADDEKVVIYLDGREVGRADHDMHGWVGMGALEDMANEVARVLGAKVIET